MRRHPAEGRAFPGRSRHPGRLPRARPTALPDASVDVVVTQPPVLGPWARRRGDRRRGRPARLPGAPRRRLRRDPPQAEGARRRVDQPGRRLRHAGELARGRPGLLDARPRPHLRARLRRTPAYTKPRGRRAFVDPGGRAGALLRQPAGAALPAGDRALRGWLALPRRGALAQERTRCPKAAAAGRTGRTSPSTCSPAGRITPSAPRPR